MASSQRIAVLTHRAEEIREFTLANPHHSLAAREVSLASYRRDWLILRHAVPSPDLEIDSDQVDADSILKEELNFALNLQGNDRLRLYRTLALENQPELILDATPPAVTASGVRLYAGGVNQCRWTTKLVDAATRLSNALGRTVHIHCGLHSYSTTTEADSYLARVRSRLAPPGALIVYLQPALLDPQAHRLAPYISQVAWNEFVPTSQDSIIHAATGANLPQDWRYLLSDAPVPIPAALDANGTLRVLTLHSVRNYAALAAYQTELPILAMQALADGAPLVEANEAKKHASDWVSARTAQVMRRRITDWVVASATRRVVAAKNETATLEEERSTILRRARSINLRLSELFAISSSLSDGTSQAEEAVQRVEALLANGVVTNIQFPSPTLVEATTKTLYAQDDRTDAWHEMGAYQITINLEECTVKFENLTRKINAYSSDMNHPHVWDDGRSCPGNFADITTNLFANDDWLTLIEASIAFLETANTDDPAGQGICYWPFVSDPASVGLPPYRGAVYPYDPGSEEEHEPYQDHEGRWFYYDYDREEYLHEDQWEEDGINIFTGTYFNEDGYDWNGDPDPESAAAHPPFEDDNGYKFEWDVDRQEYLLDREWTEDYRHISTGRMYNPDGYDIDGYDLEGYDADGYDRNGEPRPEETATV